MPRPVFCFKGAIVANNMLSPIMATINEWKGDFKVLEFDVNTIDGVENSFLRLEVMIELGSNLEACSDALLSLGMVEEDVPEALFKPTTKDCFVPDNFYALVGCPMQVYVNGEWRAVLHAKSNAVVVKRDEAVIAKCLYDIKKGDLVLCGDKGIRPLPVQSHTTSNQILSATTHSQNELLSMAAMTLYDLLYENRATQKKTIFLCGSGVFRSESGKGAQALAKLASGGFISGLIADSTAATLDAEQAMFKTVHGVSTLSAQQDANDHRNFMRTVNRISGYGSIAGTIEAGALTSGLFHELHKKNIPFCLPPCVGDIGPLPDVILDMIEARHQMAAMLDGVDTLVVLANLNIAMGAVQLIPSSVHIVFVNYSQTARLHVQAVCGNKPLNIIGDASRFIISLAEHLE